MCLACLILFTLQPDSVGSPRFPSCRLATAHWPLPAAVCPWQALGPPGLPACCRPPLARPACTLAAALDTLRLPAGRRADVTLLLFFAGLLIRPVDMPAYWKWFSYIDFLKYSWGSLMVNQFEGALNDVKVGLAACSMPLPVPPACARARSSLCRHPRCVGCIAIWLPPT